VDDDINPRDPDAVIWALSFRMQPHRDIRVTQGKSSMCDYSSAPLDAPDTEQIFPFPTGTSAIMIDATRKWPYTPVSLPRQEFMEKARALWEQLGLPKLDPKTPWHGYSLGYWTDENVEEAELAIRGDHYATGRKLATRGKKCERFSGTKLSRATSLLLSSTCPTYRTRSTRKRWRARSPISSTAGPSPPGTH